jgi:hypothetical protein
LPLPGAWPSRHTVSIAGGACRRLQLTDGPVTVLRLGHGLTATTREIMVRVRTEQQPWLLAAGDPTFLDALDATVEWGDWVLEGCTNYGSPDTLEGLLAGRGGPAGDPDHAAQLGLPRSGLARPRRDRGQRTGRQRGQTRRRLPVRDEDAAGFSPLGYRHINVLGRYNFPTPSAEQRLRRLREPDAEAS